MTKQERNDVILQAMQSELQDKPYAKEKLAEAFELWVQGLVAQGNQLLAGQEPGQEPGQGATQAEEPAGGPPPDEGSAEPAPDEGGQQ